MLAAFGRHVQSNKYSKEKHCLINNLWPSLKLNCQWNNLHNSTCIVVITFFSLSHNTFAWELFFLEIVRKKQKLHYLIKNRSSGEWEKNVVAFFVLHNIQLKHREFFMLIITWVKWQLLKCVHKLVERVDMVHTKLRIILHYSSLS